MEKVIDLSRWNKEHVKNEQELQHLFDEVESQFSADPNPERSTRREHLLTLKKSLLEHRKDLVAALNEDYGFRSEFDSVICDILPAVEHINYTLKKLTKWLKPSRRHSGLMLNPSKVSVHYQPVGVVGVMVPWNFPIVLSVAPVITALAAGNKVMVKFSEFTPSTNQVLSRIFAQLEGQVYSVDGDVTIARAFSQLPFNHLIFTGSTTVGRSVAQEAAKNLTPVTLELGGKSPVIIASDADITRAIDAIMLGKSVNAGQICVAPDYVLLPEGQQDAFAEQYLQRYRRAFCRKNKPVELSQIINDKQYQRLQGLLSDAKEKGARITTIENVEVTGRQMLPHLVMDVRESMLVMQEEIFGPILPVIGYQKIEEAFEYIRSKPKPLALYLMSDDKELQKKVTRETLSGGLAINDTLLHLAAHDAPFGGVGASGMGQYHGIEGFLAFSKTKTVLVTPSWLPRSRWVLRHRKGFERMLRWFLLR
ncbi:coniferyl aldehyde dehydrogenase [Vibrio sinensis]|uniref:Aldehyde dehydrogenase n=1 Tax=Vibrio sinensis TaxID=2302434 RepID=A0A3A6QU55_9VIBR|nr:coniferyl aldehyde dehydrogenase [Vibrio sinensis]RJX65197.1 coniferyl aldehyde dehydrogenase [Vibrio sinensis]